MKELRGITWNHPRGYASIECVTSKFCKLHPDIEIHWDRRSLKDFGDFPITELAKTYDLIMLDHPFMGTAADGGVLLPLDEWMPESYMKEQQKNSVGKSHNSYFYQGHQWALAVDAAAQVAVFREDLLGETGRKVPKSWEDVLDLMNHLPKNMYVGLPLCATDAYCSFLSLCANMAGTEFFDENKGLDPKTAVKALDFLKVLLPGLYPDSLNMNPIQMLELMSHSDTLIYAPLLFGYSNYSRNGCEGSLLTFTDIPGFCGRPDGSILGGVGLAVSAYCKWKSEAVSFVSYAASGSIQKKEYYESGGQPGHRSAWIDEKINEDSHGFFRNTLRTLDACYIRPRVPDYNKFQEKAGEMIHEFLEGGRSNSAELVEELNRIYRTIVLKKCDAVNGELQEGPLQGVRVLDLTHHMAGPIAGQKLGDFGADVLKIEPVGYGEWSRIRPIGNGWIGNLNMSMLAVNRNKKGMTLNLKSEKGLQIFHELVKTADIVLSNFRPTVNQRLMIDYNTLKNINPGIIYCSITGFGEDGPYAERPGQDLLVQAMSGVTWNAGRRDDPPVPLGTFAVDVSAGINALSGILAALYYRERTGKGQKICVNMLSSIMDMQVQEFTEYINTGRRPERTEELLAHPEINSPYGIHRTKDSFLALAMAPFDKLANALDCPALLKFTKWEDGQLYRDEIFKITAEALSRRTTDEWVEHLDKLDVWCAPVKNYDEVAADPQIKHNGTIQTITHPKYGALKVVANPVAFSLTPVTYKMSPPELGEHTEEVLVKLGYSEGEIEDLKEQGIIQKDMPGTFKI